MMKIGLLFTALSIALLSTAPAGAESHEGINRFSITKTADGFIRLDKKTGAISLCTTSGSSVTCRMGADERQAYQQEIATINGQIATMEMRLAAIEAANKSAVMRPEKSAKAQEKDFDRALKFADKAFRHFFNLMQEIKPAPKKDAI